MKIAYLIICHKNPTQLARLIKRLTTSNSYFFIHIDRNVNIEVFYKILRTLNNQNIYYIKNRVKVHWGGFSVVKAILNGLVEILNSKKKKDYIVLLSGQDYPIKNNEYISNFLLQNDGKEFVEFGQMPRKKWIEGGMNRINKYHFMDIGNRYLKYGLKILSNYLPKRHFSKNFKLYGGTLWLCITYDCSKFIIDFIHKNRDFVKFFKYVYLPDEIFFHTIILNSIFFKNVINDDIHYINWDRKDFDGLYPAILNKHDFKTLASSSKLIARKFDINYDKEILDLIDNKILGIR